MRVELPNGRVVVHSLQLPYRLRLGVLDTDLFGADFGSFVPNKLDWLRHKPRHRHRILVIDDRRKEAERMYREPGDGRPNIESGRLALNLLVRVLVHCRPHLAPLKHHCRRRRDFDVEREGCHSHPMWYL